ncbi:hypothetical protein DRO56_05055 [Candidatus Bathyarchaeota archaeon]|nr:MAG: class I SAM-dependent methyltransferase [Candidatus Bathyarchaeota archaeon]RLI31529.1 MAG: hypothetical protein DRO56_05055 [Candidatus Bathyarchaeota archaeon]
MKGREEALENVIEAFDRSAGTYEDWYRTPMGRYVLRAEVKGLEALLPREGVGVEIGSGTGIFAELLTGERRKILCVDPSAEMALRSKGKGLPTILGVAEEPPLKHRSMDFIYLVTVIEFLLDPEEALSSLRSLLKPGAPLVLLAINRKSPWGRAYMEAGKRRDSIFRYARFYTPEEASTPLRKAGYRIAEVLMALDVPPNGTPSGEPKLYAPEELRDAGVFLIKGIPS